MIYNSLITNKDIDIFLSRVKALSYKDCLCLYDFERLIIIDSLTQTARKTFTFFDKVNIYEGFNFEDTSDEFSSFIDYIEINGDELFICTTNGRVFSLDLYDLSIQLLFEENLLAQNDDYRNCIFEQYMIDYLNIYSKVDFIDYSFDKTERKNYSCIISFDLKIGNEKVLYETSNEQIIYYYIQEDILIMLLSNRDAETKYYILVLDLKNYKVLKRINDYQYNLSDHIYYDTLEKSFILIKMNKKYVLYSKQERN